MAKSDKPPAEPLDALRAAIDRLRPWWPEDWKDELVREALAGEAPHDALIDGLARRREADVECLRQQLGKVMARLVASRHAGHREDLVQEATLRVLGTIERHGDACKLSWAFLWTVAQSSLFDFAGRQRRRPELSIEDLETEHWAAPDPGPDAGLRDQELGAAVRACLQGLSADERRAVGLDLQGHKPREIAAILGWSPKQVDNRLFNGRKKLRRCLEEAGYRRLANRRPEGGSKP